MLGPSRTSSAKRWRPVISASFSGISAARMSAQTALCLVRREPLLAEKSIEEANRTGERYQAVEALWALFVVRGELGDSFGAESARVQGLAAARALGARGIEGRLTRSFRFTAPADADLPAPHRQTPP